MLLLITLELIMLIPILLIQHFRYLYTLRTFIACIIPIVAYTKWTYVTSQRYSLTKLPAHHAPATTLPRASMPNYVKTVITPMTIRVLRFSYK
jgi:hypothetical protein